MTLDRAFLLRLANHLRAEVLRLAWRRKGWPESDMDAARWERLGLLVRQGEGRSSVGGGIDAWVAATTFRLAPASSAPTIPIPACPLPIPGSAPWGDGRVVATLDPDSPRDETFDLDRLSLPLHLRAPEPGDRLDPLGLDGHTRPLNDVFRGLGVAKANRPRIPLVCDERGIVWVVGHRIGHRVRLTADTRRTLGLRWMANPSCD